MLLNLIQSRIPICSLLFEHMLQYSTSSQIMVLLATIDLVCTLDRCCEYAARRAYENLNLTEPNCASISAVSTWASLEAVSMLHYL